MKVTYKWLKDFVDIDISADILAEKLTSAGMEVEEIIHQNEHLHDVVVGKIEKIEKHPAADKLQICQVNIGEKHVQIITAATNIFEGAIVPVSLPGADLANGVKIQKSKLRGVESEGMFCSGEELGIDENYIDGAGIDGILILPENFKIGQSIEEALGLDDVIFDVSITPNRPDCMSVIGLAREVCAILDKTFKEPNLTYKSQSQKAENEIEIDRQSDLCYRYMAAVIKDVKIEKSPDFIRRRLFSVGIKSINTIVDLTNYVLIEMGQPMHAFDKSLIAGNKIVIRQGKEGEKIEALNHSSYVLSQNELVIADADKPMVIAGVIGGTNSCINNATKDVVIESAVFDLKSIRLTSKKFGVRTDSSARYEKGVYFNSAALGLNRFLSLIDELNLGKILSGVIDKSLEAPKTRVVECSSREIDEILGVKIDDQEKSRILNALGIASQVSNGKIVSHVPDYREDIENAYDLAEEIIRIFGYEIYNKCDKPLFDEAKVTEGGLDSKTALERKLKKAFVFNGFYEIVGYSLCPPDICEKLLINDNRRFLIKIANPVGEEIGYMRSCMAHSMLSTLAYNQSVGNRKLSLFECGRTYEAGSLPLVDRPNETNWLSFASTEMEFSGFKAVVEAAIGETGVKYSVVRSSQPFLHPGVSADLVTSEGEVFASFGRIHPLVAKNYELPKTVVYGQINVDKLIQYSDKKYIVKPISKYPITERDIAVVVKENISNADLMSAIKSACGKVFYDVKLFDVYRSQALGEGLKSMAYNIRLSDENKTLTDEEVTEVIAKVLKALKFRYGASLR